nr:hypothetical protein [Tanacetum cinerariifolium]
MFAFCRYIKVTNSNALVDSLSNVWIGKLRLHANVARFDRNTTVKSSYANEKVVTPKAANSNRIYSFSNVNSYAFVAKKPLDDDKMGPDSVNNERGDVTLGFLEVDIKYLGGLWILSDFNSLEARDNFLNHKGILPWFSSLKPWHDDFVVEERLVWLEIEGVPIRAWEHGTFKSICNKWGDMLFCDDSNKCNMLSKRFFIKSTHSQLIFATLLVIIKKTTYAIHAILIKMRRGGEHEHEKEENVNESDENFFDDNGDTHFKVANDIPHVHQDFNKENSAICANVPVDNDPFGLEPLINKTGGKVYEYLRSSKTLNFPPGFSPKQKTNESMVFEFPPGYSLNVTNFQQDTLPDCNANQPLASESISLGDSHKKVSFSLLERLEETIKIRVALGLNIEGCESTLAALIDNNGDRKETRLVHVDLWMIQQVWGNSHFDFAFMSVRALDDLVTKWDGVLVAMRDFNEIDQGLVNEMDLSNRRDSIRIMGELNKPEASDVAQKAKIKWVMEGDENSNFFHATLKKNRRQLSIKGIFPKGCNSSFIALIPKVTNATFVSDFWPISLIRCQYKIIGKILANRLSRVIGSCISPEQSAFIKGRNILDVPLVLSYLLNARASGLVNGSPTKEFEIVKGLSHGAPLSSFLFILAMEGLHALIHKAEDMGLFKGVNASEEDILAIENAIGCGAAKCPFKYLGVPVGGNMGRCSN